MQAGIRTKSILINEDSDTVVYKLKQANGYGYLRVVFEFLGTKNVFVVDYSCLIVELGLKKYISGPPNTIIFQYVDSAPVLVVSPLILDVYQLVLKLFYTFFEIKKYFFLSLKNQAD